MPAFLAPLAPGYYSSEGGASISMEDTGYTFHALVTPFGSARLVTFLDIDEFEAQQNQDSMWTALGSMMFVAFIAVMIGWLHNNLVRPVKNLANRMQAIDPAIKGRRLPMDLPRPKFRSSRGPATRTSNAWSDSSSANAACSIRPSHEFRTPISVISGADRCVTHAGTAVSAQPAWSASAARSTHSRRSWLPCCISREKHRALTGRRKSPRSTHCCRS